MRYSVGDTVRIRSDLEFGDRYSVEVNTCYGLLDASYEMEQFRGKVVTIESIDQKRGYYRIIEDKGRWNWSIGMFSEYIPFIDESEWKSLMDTE